MAFDKFLIAPYEVGAGLQTNKRPWLIADYAFAQQVNMYTYRSRTIKRFGTELMVPTSPPTPSTPQLQSRVGIQVGTITAGALAGTVPGSSFHIGQAFSVGNSMFTVYIDLGGAQQMLRTDGIVAVATYNIATGAFNIAGSLAANGTPVIFYPGNPIQHIATWELGAGLLGEPVIAFDTQFAYQWGSTGWRRLGNTTIPIPKPGLWSGTELNYYSTTTYVGQGGVAPFFWVVNDNPADGIQYLDNTSAWNQIFPAINGGGDYIESARFILAYQNRLLLLNTHEFVGGSSTTYRNRARWCAIGNPLGATSWYDGPDVGVNVYGGFFDCLGTEEEIIACEFILNRLIVYFEKSTWELAYTGSDSSPFVWRKINTELGANAQNSTIPFDQQVLTFGNVGIHGCSGVSVFRIDEAIPDLVFDIENELINGESFRTAGIRDYFREMAYWAYVSADEAQNTLNRFPNRVLCYNYVTKNWSYNIDTFTAFGYFPPIQGSSQAQRILAGNQEGFILFINGDTHRNAPSLQIDNITSTAGLITLQIHDNNIVPLNFTLNMSTYVVLENIHGTSEILALNNRIFRVVSVTVDTISLFNAAGHVLAGIYIGGGTVAQVSNYDLLSKEMNPYAEQGKNVYVSKIEYQVDRTALGEVTIDYYTSTSTADTRLGSIVTGAIMGTCILDTYPYAAYPLEATSTRIWHPVYFQSAGEFLQFRIYMTDAQITNPAIAFSDLQIHSMQIYAAKQGRLQ
jgi:hypothetical protein